MVAPYTPCSLTLLSRLSINQLKKVGHAVGTLIIRGEEREKSHCFFERKAFGWQGERPQGRKEFGKKKVGKRWSRFGHLKNKKEENKQREGLFSFCLEKRECRKLGIRKRGPRINI